MLKKNQKKILSWIITLILMLSNVIGFNGVQAVKAEGITAISQSSNSGSTVTSTTGSAISTTGGAIFDIVEITDFHGQLFDSTNTKPVGAALAKVVKDVKAANPDTLIIGGGDLYQGTPVSNVLHGVPVQQVMSNIGMEVTALGNHEFDWGLNVINNETMKGANYSIVCANIYDKGKNTRPFEPYKIITKDGVKIAVIGAITQDAPNIIMPALVAPYDFKDPATEINACAKEIRDGKLADIVLADIHEGTDPLNAIVNHLHGVDAVFGGHSHSIYDDVNNDADGKAVPTLNAKNAGAGYIDLKIKVDTTSNKIVSFSPKGQNWKPVTVTTTSPTDPDCKKIADDANAALLPIFNEVIGHDDVAYTSEQVKQPYGESQLGNWMADVVKNYAKADVGMVNNGGIRLSPVPAGDITVGTTFNLMPFDNTVCSVNMTGAQLKYIFEQAVQDNGKGIQISGVKFTYDSSKPSYKPATDTTPEVKGQRVLSITRESDNSVIKDTDVLKVAAPDFVATGGDTFTGFLDPAIKATLVDSHALVRDALNADVRANKTIKVVMNNRIDNKMQVVAPVAMSIAEARTTDKKAVTITGYVSAVNGNNVFIQDNAVAPTAGICVYNTAGKTFTAHKGDKITVTGNLSTYNGLLEVTPTSADGVVTVSSGNAVTPKEVKVSDVTTALQGQLIKIKNATFTSIDNSGASMAKDATGSINVFKMPVVAGLAVNDTADITAAVTQYGATIELAVDSAADVVKTSSTAQAKISIIGTSDVHGAIYPMDYNTGAAANVGLAKVSTYVNSVRSANPNTMLIDNGDTIQGTPLVYYYNMIDTKAEYPMMKVMGAMKYDSWTLGNHEFNYGLTTLNRVIGDATKESIPVLSANTYNADNTNFVKPYIIKSFNINGKTIKVGILGLTTKCIPCWEDPAHYAGLHFNDLVDEAKKWVPQVRAAGADVVIVSAHSGTSTPSDTIPENQADAIAQQVSGIDAILCGHAHTGKTYSFKNPDGKVVPVVEPKNGDGIFSQIDIDIDAAGKVSGIESKNVTVDDKIAADPAILAIAQPYQDATLGYTNTVIGQSTDVFEGSKQLTEPSTIMELVNKVQQNAAGTQLSIAAPLSPTAKVPKGDIKRQDIMGVYVYENYLFGIKMTGKQLKNWLEWSVRYYKQTANATDPIVKDSALNVPDYNLDQLYGATYDIDLTQSACTTDSTGLVVSGNRIKNLKINGIPVNDTDVLKVAINNYRYNGGGGFMAAAGFVPGSQATKDATFYDSGKTLGDDGQVRNMMFKYVQDNKTISPTNSNNWKISNVPVPSEGGVTVQVVTTTDMHNRMVPWDYATNSALTAGSFTQVATGIKELRAANPNTVLIDDGDVCQDNSAALFLDSSKFPVFPMIQGMNALNYDAWTLGNHEFNYGMDKVKEYVKTSKAPVLCADVYDKDGTTRIAKNYTIVERGGIKIGIIGLVTPNITAWDAENLKGYKVTDPVAEVKAAVKELTGKVDIMIGAFHMGEPDEYNIPNSGLVDVVSACPELSMVIGGHMHVQIANEYIYNGLAYAKIVDSKTGAVTYSGLKNDGVTKVPVTEAQYNEAVDKGVLIVEAGKFGEALGKVDLTFTTQNGKPVLTKRLATNLPMAKEAQDPGLVSIFAPYDKIAKDDAVQVVGKLVGADLAPANEVKGITQAQLQPTAMIDLINKTQMYYGQKIAKDGKPVDVSAAAAFRDDANIKVGDIKKSDTALIYKYDNTLYVLDVTGKQLKQYMEWSASYYNQYKDGDLTISFNSNIPGYNYDMFTGVKYNVNVSKPAGQRIENLTRMDGTPIQDTDKLRLAVNNYRSSSQLTTYGPVYNKANGDTLPVLVAKSEDTMSDAGRVRDLIRSYIVDVKGGTIKPECDNNWKVTGNNWDFGKRSVLVKAVNDGKLSIKPSLDGKTSNGISLTWQDILDAKIAKEVKVETKTDANSNSVTTMDLGTIDTNGTNLVTIKEEKPESKIQLQIPVAGMKNGKGSFALSTGTVSLNIPMSAIDPSKLKDGDTVQVSKSIMDVNQASTLLAKKPEGTKASGKIFTFAMAISHSDNTPAEDIHNFASTTPVAVTLNLTTDDIKGMDTSNLAAFSFNETTNKWEDMGGAFNQATMTFAFNTPHFTNFTIMERPAVITTPVVPSTPSTGSGNHHGDNTSSGSGSTVTTPSTPALQRIAGENRIDTSIAIAKAQFADKQPDAVVLTAANDFPDALSGSGVAYKFNAPLLLVDRSVSESKNVLDYITTNLSKNKNIYILGGTGAVSTEISDYLAAQGYNMIRLGGKDRYETNQKIVDTLNVVKGTPIVITSGNGFADALSISSVADEKGYPVLLNDKENLSTNVGNYITNIQPTTVYIVGGTGVLSANIEAQIKNLNGNIKIVRLGGQDRYETSMMIVNTFNLNTNTITVASGTSFPDALSGSVLAARKNSSILLVDNNDITRQKDLLSKQKITNLIVLGGEGVVSSGTVNSLLH